LTNETAEYLDSDLNADWRCRGIRNSGLVSYATTRVQQEFQENNYTQTGYKRSITNIKRQKMQAMEKKDY